MLKLKLPYFGNLMWRTDSFEKTQMVTAAMKLKDAYSLEGKLWPT